MKRAILFIVCVAASILSVQAQEHRHHRHERESKEGAGSAALQQESPEQPKYNGAHISFECKKHNFGEVQRKGGNLTVKFEYVNDGTEPLVITRIATSCTCIHADYRRRPLDVGEHGVIELTYEPHKMEAGAFNKVVQVYSNSVDGMHLLTVSGSSIEK